MPYPSNPHHELPQWQQAVLEGGPHHGLSFPVGYIGKELRGPTFDNLGGTYKLKEWTGLGTAIFEWVGEGQE